MFDNLNISDELKNLSEEERKYALDILGEISKKGSSKKFDDLRYADYEEIPVDIYTFLHDPNYLGKGLINEEGKYTVFPYWEKKLKEVFPDNITTRYNTFILSGAIGLGKSFIAVLCILYQLYRMMCLKDPYIHYGLQPIDKITFAFMNITLDASKGVGWDKAQSLLQASPWFMSKGTVSGRDTLVWQPPKGIELIAGSQSRHIIGRAVFSAFFDEISFQLNQDVNKQIEKAKTLINTAQARMISRFMHGEYNPTLLLLASSKRTEQSFLETFIDTKKKKESKTTLIVDEPQWVIRTDKDSPNKFYVAVGNKFLDSEVLPLNVSEADLDIYRNRGFTLLKVPMGYYEQFLDDIDIALTDCAGISTSNTTRYISGPRLVSVKNYNIKNPFSKDIIEVGNGLDDKTQYWDYFDLNQIDPTLKSRPMYIHLDMSISGDKTGIAGIWIIGKKPPAEGQQPSKELYYRLAFSVAIKAPKGHQISFEKNRQFIYWLREQGFNIKGVSTDTFQSADLGQSLTAHHFNYSIISVDRCQDRVCLPYQYLKSTIYEQRIEMYDSKLLTDELIGLERDGNGKIDHSPSGINSKDTADALCLDGDTKIYTLSGKNQTLRELYDNPSDEWILAYNTDTHKLEPVKIDAIVNNGYKDNIVKLTFDNGKELICTDDHLLLDRSGNYIQAKDSLNVSLMPFNYENKIMFKNRDYRYVYNPNSDMSSSGEYLHKIVAESLLHEDKINAKNRCDSRQWVVIHHKDCNRFNNCPENLEYLTNVEHSRQHVSLNSTDLKRQQLSEAAKRQLQNGSHSFKNMSIEQRKLNGHNSMVRMNKSDKHRYAVSASNKKRVIAGMHNFQLNPQASQTNEAKLKRYNTFKERYGDFGFKSAIIQQKCREACLRNNGYDNPRHSPILQHKMKIARIKNAWNKICDHFSFDTNQHISLLDFKIYCYQLSLSCSSKIDDIKEAGIPIDISTYSESEYLRLRRVGNCVRTIIKKLGKDTFTYTEFLDAYNKAITLNESNFRYRFKDCPSYDDIIKMGFKLYNHRVIKIEHVSGREVFDIKLSKIHNFAICAGIFVHNCGAIWNASQHAEEFAFDYGENLNQIFQTNSNQANLTQDQVVVDFETELKKAMDPRLKSHQQNKPADTAFMDFGLGAAQPVGSQFLSDGILIW